MYQPSQFREERIEVMHDLICAHPFASLITYASDGISANHIPMILDPETSDNGTLRGHIAKANPLSKNFDPEVEVLTIFQGPHHYVAPAWYPSKKQHGKVVPTWNYAVVHAYGTMQVIDDADWLRQQVQALTSEHEAHRPKPWAVNDAPADYVEKMLKGVIGLEIPISRLQGKWKVSQNKSDEDRAGVAQGLNNEATAQSLEMADLIPK